MNLIGKLSAGLMSGILMILPAPIALAQVEYRADIDVEEIRLRASNFAVKIESVSILNSQEGAPAGSGVFIAKGTEPGTYYVVTNYHVIKPLIPICEQGDCIAVPYAQDLGESLDRPDVTIVETYPEQDIAILRLRSDRAYTIPDMGEPILLEEGSPVYVAGWPNSSEELRVVDAEITNKDPLDEQQQLTYRHTSFSSAERGMSGGPIVNQNGQLVGIHAGVTDLQDNSDLLGISIDTMRATIREPDVLQALGASPFPPIGSPILVSQPLVGEPLQTLGERTSSSREGESPKNPSAPVLRPRQALPLPVQTPVSKPDPSLDEPLPALW